jgi:hydrogenase-4 membrane subunit HyfE
VLAPFGIPLIVELGVFLDVMMGFLVMQVFVYHIHGTFGVHRRRTVESTQALMRDCWSLI